MLRKSYAVLLLFLLVPASARAQLNQTFSHLFDAVLVEGFALSPEAHGQHFLPAASEANHALVPALNSLIASNISSFPITTSAAGLTFDFSTGQPVPIRGSQGPIFGEEALTIGHRKFVFGFNATHLSLDHLRGMPLDEMRFTFLHEDADQTGILGDNINESDLVDIYPQLDVDVSIFALFATFGVTDYIDVSVALPLVDIRMRGTMRAEVQSFTLGALGEANHHFGDDARDPHLIKEHTYEEDAAGIGDLAIRFKAGFPAGNVLDLGALLDIRVPTGDELDFLGTGNVSVRSLLLLSRQFGGFTPHLNVGYDYREAYLDSDEFEVAIGFDQKATDAITLAIDFLGEFDVQRGDAIDLLPGRVNVLTQNQETGAHVLHSVSRSNIADYTYDSTLNAAIGLRIAPAESLQFLTNLLIPLNDRGLRSMVAPTIGFALTY